MWPAFDINGVGEHIYKDNFGNERTVYQTREAADRNWAAIKQNRSVNDNKRAHYEQFIKEQQTYADRRNKAGKRQNRSGEAVKASYKTTPISKIKSTFRRISSRLGGIKLSNIFK